MPSSREWFLYGLCVAACCSMVTGARYLPPEVEHFPKCNIVTYDCPTNSACEVTTSGYDYCVCNDNFYNTKERTSFTYPGGECVALCDRTGNRAPCPCLSGYTMNINQAGLYICTNKCTTHTDCPANAICQRGRCQCLRGFCNKKSAKGHCATLVALDGECVDLCDKKGSSTPCACLSGSIMKKNDEGLYICTSNCENSQDCPSKAECRQNSYCYCSDGSCSSKSPKGKCDTLVTLDGECVDQNLSTSPTSHPKSSVGITKTATISTIVPATSYSTLQKFTTSTQAKTPKIDQNLSTIPTSQPKSSVGITKTATISTIVPATSYSTLQKFTTGTQAKTPKIDQNLSTSPTSQPKSSVGITKKATISTIVPATSYSTLQKFTTSTQAKTPKIEVNQCQSQPSSEQEECKRLNRQDTLCPLLKSLASIQKQSCESNNTTISVKDVAIQVTKVLNQTPLTNLSVSDLRTAVTSILETVETSLLATFTKDLRNQNIRTPELEVQMKVSTDICIGETDSITLNVLGNTMNVPCSLMRRETGGSIFILHKELDTRLNSSVLGALGGAVGEGTNEIVSQVVSGAITINNTKNLDPPVSFYLEQQKDLRPSFIFKCVFWDTKKKIWTSRGCETKLSDKENFTLCFCSHLSTFAVLMAPGEIQVDAGLVVISRIGLTLSLVCLCISLLTFILCRSIRSAHTSVLIALCGCLFLGQLLVLFGLHQTWNTVLCSVIAGSLHFLFLCAFSWMSIESILLFMTVRNLQAMNYMTAHRSHFPYVCLVGFSIPLIIVVISAAIRSDGYRNYEYCWLNRSLVWSFLGPVCVFIMMNFILLVLTFYLLKQKLASLNSNVSTLKHTRLLTFKAMSQLFILGCTWIVGFFQFGSGSLVVSYIFTICNSLQGVYIFFVHCLLNRQVREEYSRTFCRLRSKKSESEVMSGSTIPMGIKFSDASEYRTSEISQREETQVAWKK